MNNSPKSIILNFCAKKSTDLFHALLLKLADGILNDFSDPIPSLKCLDFSIIDIENAKGIRVHHLTDSFRAEASPEELYVAYQIYYLRQDNMRKISAPYFFEGDKSLEIGCGMLNKSGLSYLTNDFPKNIADGFNYCEINPELVHQSLLNYPQASILECDIRSLSDAYGESTFDHVTGTNTLDTLTTGDLHKTIDQIGIILKSQQTLVHYANLEPFIYSLIHNLAHDQHILFPLLDRDDNRQFCILGKEKYWKEVRAQIVEENILGKEKIAFLDYVAGLSALQQERLCNALVFNDEQNVVSAIGRYLLKWGEGISPMHFYEQSMREGLETRGFTLLECRYENTAKVIQARPTGPYNQQSIVYGPDGKKMNEDRALEWGRCRLEVKTHVIVASVTK